ncbi:MAG: SWIM zinc finger family protein [Oxalobacteraceae bacterium]|nr:SWIM zinc finger family protein [Oxalobacteraceae bacterium]
MAHLNELISLESLEDLADAAAFIRGRQYFASGAVSQLQADAAKLSAHVAGTHNYRVTLRDEDGMLGYDCTCPRAAEGYFCKHCVAAGLAWLAQQEDAAAPSSKQQRKKRDPWQEIRAHLASQPPEALITLLLEVAARDERLYRLLLLKSERAAGPAGTLKAFRRAIDSATKTRGFVDWQEAGAYAADLDQMADSLQELLNADSAAMLVGLAERAIERIEHAMEQVDDSNGEVGGVLERIGALHLAACELAQPDPGQLAERLFRYEMTLPFETFLDSARVYRNALGITGLQRFRGLATVEWDKVKPKGADAGVTASFDSARSSITQIMETLAEISGDIEELVAIKSRDLSSAYRFLDIAEICLKAGQAEQALAWAERGLQAFAERPDNRLRDFLVALYLERGRNEEALHLTWIQFEQRPILEYYKKLSAVATRLQCWPQQRQRALQRIDAVIMQTAGIINQRQKTPESPDQSLRVEVALWEKDLDAAWHAVHQGNCRQVLLIGLAGILPASRAADAISLYRRVIPDIVAQTNNAAYEEAIRLIRRVGQLMSDLDQRDALADYLAALRIQYKPKRNFIKLLDGIKSTRF